MFISYIYIFQSFIHGLLFFSFPTFFFSTFFIHLCFHSAKFFINDPSVPRACKNNNKVVRFARELSDFCRMNGQQRLALSRQQCILFLQKQGLTAAEQMASGMCFVVCCLIHTV